MQLALTLNPNTPKSNHLSTDGACGPAIRAATPMDLPRILPWLNWGEWNKGRELLYSPNFSDKVAGVGLTRVWRSRGKVPHAVDATAQLVEAVLCDQAYFLDRTGNSTSSAGRTILHFVLHFYSCMCEGKK